MLVRKIVAISFAVSLCAFAGPWDGHESFDALQSSIQQAFPLKGRVIDFQAILASNEGYRGVIAERSNVGDEFFCDFQLRKDFGMPVLINTKQAVQIIDVQPYLGADQEQSRVGVFLKLADKSENGVENPIDLVACIRNQQRDQIEEGWTLTKESSFSLEDINILLKGIAEIASKKIAMTQ